MLKIEKDVNVAKTHTVNTSVYSTNRQCAESKKKFIVPEILKQTGKTSTA